MKSKAAIHATVDVVAISVIGFIAVQSGGDTSIAIGAIAGLGGYRMRLRNAGV